jgi:hypothetical protein
MITMRPVGLRHEPDNLSQSPAFLGIRCRPHSVLCLAMDHGITTIERAFQLAKSGSYASVADIKKRLSVEGYSIAQITGGVSPGN